MRGRSLALALTSLMLMCGAPAALVLSSPTTALAQQCSGCGCRGGPGYRGPNGQCVGWKDLYRVCGNPPTLRCKPEFVNTPPPERPKPKGSN